MDDIRFEWDPAKARENLRKHAVAFEEAETAFADDRAILLDDQDHSTDEDRFALGAVVRLISARKATRVERAQYDAQENP